MTEEMKVERLVSRVQGKMGKKNKYITDIFLKSHTISNE